MYTIISIFLMILLIPLTLTAPSINLSETATCAGNRIEEAPPEADDCITLLHSIRNAPWVQEETTFGISLSTRGHVPHLLIIGTCEFLLYINWGRLDYTETFRLVQYFPDIYKIIEKCFLPDEESRFPIGTVGIGEGGRFMVKLRRAWVLEKGGNETIGSSAIREAEAE